MNRLKLTVFLTLLLPLIANAEIAIITGSGSPIKSASADDLSRVYLGKSKSLSGHDVTPFNQANNAGITDSFNKLLLNKSSSQVKAFWSKLVFTGKGTPPAELASDADVIAAVKADPSAVGYISDAAIPGDVTVLLKL